MSKSLLYTENSYKGNIKWVYNQCLYITLTSMETKKYKNNRNKNIFSKSHNKMNIIH